MKKQSQGSIISRFRIKVLLFVSFFILASLLEGFLSLYKQEKQWRNFLAFPAQFVSAVE